ncbi:hypothetical protein DRF58_14720 [Epilithonimonas hispanica]|uniref:Uncharacterized protein n=1 Tax=Epilithonimonas hispanica TaxID=358687 RepID=A0A3D9CPT6_9FLAO|nr:hypothetical protein DRF58_14720 [Epilithonimonas hispanica]
MRNFIRNSFYIYENLYHNLAQKNNYLTNLAQRKNLMLSSFWKLNALSEVFNSIVRTNLF